MPAARPLALLFDLDGTLVDTIDLIVESAHHAFRDYDGQGPTDEEWTATIGTPLVECFRPWARDETELARLVGTFREYQLEHHDRLTHVYAGVDTVLAGLHARGHPMAIVTSKAGAIAHRTLGYVGLARHFDVVIGYDSCTRHKPDPEPVHVALARLGRSPAEALFVGDSPHDMASGNAAGVTTVAALWGPFTRAMLEPTRPAYYLERIEELPALVGQLEAGTRSAAD